MTDAAARYEEMWLKFAGLAMPMFVPTNDHQARLISMLANEKGITVAQAVAHMAFVQSDAMIEEYALRKGLKIEVISKLVDKVTNELECTLQGAANAN